jgi:hypothetical protein
LEASLQNPKKPCEHTNGPSPIKHFLQAAIASFGYHQTGDLSASIAPETYIKQQMRETLNGETWSSWYLNLWSLVPGHLKSL